MRTNVARENYFKQYPEAETYEYVGINDIDCGTLVMSAGNTLVYYLVAEVYDFKTNEEVKVLIELGGGSMHNASSEDRYIPVFSQVAVGEPMPLRSVMRQREIEDISRAIEKHETQIDELVSKLRVLQAGGDV